MKGLRRVAILLFAACVLATTGIAQADSDPGPSCRAGAPEPSPAYPQTVHTAREIAGMFVPPRTIADLLANLKIVLDRHLLVQPAFFDDEVLRTVFNAVDVQWAQPGTPGAVSERFVKPTRIARIRFDEGGSFAGIKVHVGVNHKCLDRRTHPYRSEVVIPAHTYESGYMFIELAGPAVITMGDVQRAFGSTYVPFDKECHAQLSMQYPGPEGASRDTYALNSADFIPSWQGYEQLCRAAVVPALPASHPISHGWIRLMQEDYTLPSIDMP